MFLVYLVIGALQMFSDDDDDDDDYFRCLYVVCPVFFLNLAHNFFSLGCHPLDGVTRGSPPPPLP